MSFSIERVSGNYADEPSPEKMREILLDLEYASSPRSVATMLHESGWTLAVHRDGLLVLEDEAVDGQKFMLGVDGNRAIELWLALSRGELDRVADEPWQHGQPPVADRRPRKNPRATPVWQVAVACVALAFLWSGALLLLPIMRLWLFEGSTGAQVGHFAFVFALVIGGCLLCRRLQRMRSKSRWALAAFLLWAVLTAFMFARPEGSYLPAATLFFSMPVTMLAGTWYVLLPLVGFSALVLREFE